MKNILHPHAWSYGKMAFALLLALCLITATSKAQVNITAPSLTLTGCAVFPTNTYTLGNIVIAESASNDISAFGTLILTAPANFEFAAAGTIAFDTAGDITSASIAYTSTTITITIGSEDTNFLDGPDIITLSNILIRSTHLASGSNNVIRTDGTSTIAGDVNGTVHATLTSTVTILTSPTAPNVFRCNPGILTLTASGGGTTDYLWYDAPAGGNILSTTSSYPTPPLDTTTSYYVSDISIAGNFSLSNGATTYYNTLTEPSFGCYNITPGARRIIVTQLSLQLGVLGYTEVKVYYRIGTYSGNESDITGWVQVGETYTVNVSSTTEKTAIDITDFLIPAGQLTGIYIWTSNSLAYQDGNAASSDANISISGGSLHDWCVSPFAVAGLSGYSIFSDVYYKTIECESPLTTCQAIISSPVTPAISIIANPGNIICPGESVTFTATPVNGGTAPTYQWKLNGSNIAGATNLTYTSNTLANLNSLTCVLTSSHVCASPVSASSDPIVMSVIATSVFTSHPTDVAICPNGNTSFSVISDPASGPYQWQVSKDNGATWINITTAGNKPAYSGYFTSTLNLIGVTNTSNNYRYRCISGCNHSNSALLSVIPAPIPTATGAGSCTIPSTLVLSASGASAGEVYKWYDALSGGNLLKTSIDNSDNTYSATVSATTSFYVTIRTAIGCESFPRTKVTATIYAVPVVQTNPSNVTAPEGNSTSFNVSAIGTNLTYQWQVDQGSGFNNISSPGINPEYSGWSSPTLVLAGVVSANDSNQYRCVVSGTCPPSANSAAATLHVGSEVQGGPYFHQTLGMQYTYLGTCMVATAGGRYFDNGDTTNGYANSINRIYRTFCPNAPRKAVRATLNQMEIEYTGTSTCNDMLYVQNGPNPGASILWEGCGNKAIPQILTVAGNYNAGVYTSTHQSGCLTFTFYSDASNNNNWDGWDITLSTVDFIAGPTGSTNNDCSNSTPICSDVTTKSFTYGPGITSDACTGCVTAENFTEWYLIRMATGGTVELEIVPNGVADLDFALYRNTGCGTLGDPIRCSYAGRTPPGKTGMEKGAKDLSEDALGDQWVQEIKVLTGETFLLMINEWNKPNPNHYTLDWTLTDGASFDCTIVLPIELLSFTGTCEKHHAVLNWATATETNNDQFVILKSPNYTDFRPIGYLDGAGNSNGLREYSFTDPEKNTEPMYYKIQQVDYDGQYSFSDVIVVNCEDDAEADIKIENLQDQGYLRLNFQSSPEENYDIYLIDINGKVIYKNSYRTSDNLGTITIPTDQLKSGIYQIRLTSKTEEMNERVMIN